MSEPGVWEVLEEWRREGRRFVLATVTDSRGFTPRKPGAHMLVGEDGATAGTIGGGAIEREVLDAARQLFESGGTRVVERHLTQELGMCCGGEMSVFIELVEPAPSLVIFGAGYIGRALAAVAGTCGFVVTVVDERPEWAAPGRFPGTHVELREPESFLREHPPGDGAYVVVVTHDHALDQRLVQQLLRQPLRFLGMIGSIPKQRKFALRLRARGFSDAEIARLHTPLGVSIGADTPEEIAISVMAQLIAVRRGSRMPAAWTPPVRAEAAEVEVRPIAPMAEPIRTDPSSTSSPEGPPIPALPRTAGQEQRSS